jgi:hypothetical protein
MDHQAEFKEKMVEVEKKVRALMESLGNPPHLVAIISADKEVGPNQRQCAASVDVADKLLMAHFEMMIGGIFATLAGHDHEKAQRLLVAAAAATAKEIDLHKSEQAVKNPPHKLN